MRRGTKGEVTAVASVVFHAPLSFGEQVEPQVSLVRCLVRHDLTARCSLVPSLGALLAGIGMDSPTGHTTSIDARAKIAAVVVLKAVFVG